MPITHTCHISKQEFTITDEEIDFYEKVSPVFGGRKYLIPAPILSPDERFRRRLTFRNERNLYKRKCDATGKDMVSIYSPDKPYTVYHQDYWWSDAWNPLEYGKKWNSSRSTMEQMRELLREIPHLSILSFSTENAEYNNYVGYLKDCYYTFAGGKLENVHYSYWMTNTQDSLDCYHILDGRELYGCVRTEYSSLSQYLSNCKNCHRSEYLSWCVGCTDCIASRGLENAQYVIGNTQYTKDEYELKKQTLGTKEKKSLFDSIPQKKSGNIVIASSDSDGHHIIDSNSVKQSRFVNKGNDCYHIVIGENIETCIDTNFLNDSTRLFECISGAWDNGNMCCSFLNESSDCLYSIECFASSHLFLCTGLRNASYCILNKQYTKEEYELLVPQIIEKMNADGEWGEFFPASMSPFGYNETVANEYYPLTREEVLEKAPFGKEVPRYEAEDFQKGNKENPQSLRDSSFQKGALFNWSDYEAPFPHVEKVIPANKLPDTIEGIPDDILNWAIECEVSKKPFRIIKQELEFYRKHSIPIPRRHPDVRHMDRMRLFQQ